MQDLQEALAVQQATMIQMQSLGMAGMFAHAARPPPVPHMPPHMFPPGLPSQPIPQQPIPVSTVSHQPTPSSTGKVNNYQKSINFNESPICGKNQFLIWWNLDLRKASFCKFTYSRHFFRPTGFQIEYIIIS